MPFKFFLAVLFVLALPIAINPIPATGLRWNLQITDPGFEIKNVQLDEKLYRPYLKKTAWRCWVGPTETKKLPQTTLIRRSLTCSYSIRNTGRAKTFASCSPQRPYGEGILELYDERKKMTFRLMLTCHQGA